MAARVRAAEVYQQFRDVFGDLSPSEGMKFLASVNLEIGRPETTKVLKVLQEMGLELLHPRVTKALVAEAKNRENAELVREEIRPGESMGAYVASRKPFEKGAVVLKGIPFGTVNQSVHSIRVGLVDMRFTEVIESMNHSCLHVDREILSPNVGVRSNEDGGYDWIALRPIKAGEQLVWDYGITELSVDNVVGKCLCGAGDAETEHHIVGWDLMSPYLKGWYVREQSAAADILTYYQEEPAVTQWFNEHSRMDSTTQLRQLQEDFQDLFR